MPANDCSPKCLTWRRALKSVSLVQVKCLRVLQYFPVPDDPATNKALDGVLKRIITGTTLPFHHAYSLFLYASNMLVPTSIGC